MNWDFIYSVTAHECLDCIYNLYENIMKFHKGKNVLVVFHLNIDLYNKKEALPEHDNLRYHPRPTNKVKYSSDIFLAHLANYDFVRDEDFKFFCTLASNCMFVRQPDFDLIDSQTPQLQPKNTGFKIPDTTAWLWDNFMRDTRIAEAFKKRDVEPVIKMHEGAYFRKQVFNYIFYFCVLNHITKENFTMDEAWSEETILPSLEKYATGKVSQRYCALIQGMTEGDLNKIIQTGTCPSLIGDHHTIVKVPRDMNNELRKMINSL